MQSPIIFIDPTFKERNALAALSEETYKKFQKEAKAFLKTPKLSAFDKKEVNEKEFNLIIKVKTDKQAGDVAGSKLKKFFRFIVKKLEKEYEIKNKSFIYDEKQTAKLLFEVKKKKEILIEGPLINRPVHVTRFRKKHKNVFQKKGRAYAKEKPKNIKKIINMLKKDKVLKEMEIKIQGFSTG